MTAKGIFRLTGLGLVLLAALALTGCSAVQVMQDPPRVNLVSVFVDQATVLEQRYRLTVRLQNHTPADISISGMSFDLFINNKLFASGVSDHSIALKGFGEGTLEVMASSTAFALYRQLMVLAKGDREKLSYRLAGKLGLGGLASVPYEKNGELALKPDSSGKMGFTVLE